MTPQQLKARAHAKLEQNDAELRQCGLSGGLHLIRDYALEKREGFDGMDKMLADYALLAIHRAAVLAGDYLNDEAETGGKADG